MSQNPAPVPGHVDPDGPSLTWSADPLIVRKASVSEMDNNIYLLTCRATGAQLLVDAADNPGRIQELIDEGTGRLDALVTTHSHWDHVRALSELAGRPGLVSYAGADDAPDLPEPAQQDLRHGDTVPVGEVALTVIALRGHTPGSIALAHRDDSGRVWLFTGDSLFPGGPGATHRPEDFEQLMDDLEARVFGAFGDETVVLPGHGDNTTLGTERPHLAEWRARGW